MTSAVKRVELATQVTVPYVETGNPSGVPILLLHGFLDSWRSFELVLPHLPDSVHAFVPSQRGHGDATAPQTGFRIGDFSADVAAFMDAVDLDGAVIAGHSSHALVAQRFAIDHLERTLGLILIASPTSLRDKPRLREIYDATISKLSDPVDPTFVREFQQGTFVRPVPPEFFEAQLRESMKIPARVWREAFAGLLEEDLSGEREAIKAPTLIVWGDKDEIVSRSDQETLTAAIADSRLMVYRGTGHAPHWEEPERIAADLTTFVTTL